MKSLRILVTLAALCSAPLLADEAQKPVPAQPAEIYAARTFTSPDGRTLGYRLLMPKNYDAAQKYPLVLFLHGAGERGTDNIAQLKNGAPLVFAHPDIREKFPCFLVAPQCSLEQKWSAVDDWKGPVKFSEESTEPTKLALGALDALMKEFSIDPDRVYLAGLSMGGYGTWDLLTRDPQRWAAAVPVCGGGDPMRIAAAKGVAIWAMHGTKDNVVPVIRTQELIGALKAAGGEPLFSEYPYASHDAWSTAFAEPLLLPWLFAQKRGAVVAWKKVARTFSQPPSNLCPGEGPMQSGIWFRPLWETRREQWAKDASADQGAVVFFGDSITQGWKSLATDFPNFKVANRGISGDTTRGLRTRIQGDVLDLHPKAVAMLIGTNDLDQGAAPEIVAANLKAIVDALHLANPAMPIVISKVMPRGPNPGMFPEKIRALNALYEETLKNDAKVTFCDTWSLFDDGQALCKKEEFPDMLHPNAAGYAKWVAALQPIFEKLQLAK